MIHCVAGANATLAALRHLLHGRNATLLRRYNE
jgi:hypothetical protein